MEELGLKSKMGRRGRNKREVTSDSIEHEVNWLILDFAQDVCPFRSN